MEFIFKTLLSATFYFLMLLLVWGTMTGETSLVQVAAAIYWVVIFLGAGAGIFTVMLSCALLREKDAVEMAKGIKTLMDITKQRSTVFRFFRWVCLIVITVSLAYSGWVFTAICYLLVGLVVRFFISVARDNLAKLYEKLNDK